MRCIKGLLIIVLLLFATEAWSCSVTASNINFSEYDVFTSTALDATGVVNVTCGVPYTVKLDAGVYSDSGFITRKMQISGGFTTLNYNLYRDTARSQVWGDGTGSTVVQSGTAATGFTVYGRLPALQTVRVGLYHDTVIVTLEW